MGVIKNLPMCYAITPQLALAALGNVTPEFTISNDDDFVLTELRCSIIKAAAFSGRVMIQIQTKDGTLWSNGGIDAVAFCQSNQNPGAGFPIYFPSIFIPRNTTIVVSITNNNAEALVSIQVQFWGYKPNQMT